MPHRSIAWEMMLKAFMKHCHCQMMNKRTLKVLERFEEHFVPKRNVIHEPAVFNQKIQKQDESAESFVRSLCVVLGPIFAETYVEGCINRNGV